MYLNVALKDSGTGAGNIETTLVIMKGLRLIFHAIIVTSQNKCL